MYVAALLMLRVGERRTLARWTVVDFVAAAAIGAVVGRTAVASSQSFLTGAVALAVIIAPRTGWSAWRGSSPSSPDWSTQSGCSSRTAGRAWTSCGCAGSPPTTCTPSCARRGVFDLAAIQYLLYESSGELP